MTTATWRDVADRIEADIRSGVFAPGAKLPIEPELAARFSVGRHTLRRAIAELSDRGVLAVRQGSGTYVASPVIRYEIKPRTRFTEIVTRQHRSPSGQLVAEGEVAAEEKVARGVDIAPGTPVLFLETLRAVDGRPATLATHFLPAGKFRGAAEIFRRTGSITAVFEHFGAADYTRRETILTAAMPDARDTHLLRLGRNQPIMVVEAVNVDRHGTPVEFAITRANPALLQYAVIYDDSSG